MKKLLLTICMLAMAGTVMAASGTFTEDFSIDLGGAGFVNLDSSGAGNEAIRRASGTQFSPVTSWAWGAYNAGTQGIGSIASPHVVYFKQNALAVGSYMYTRFDTQTTDFVAGAKTPSVIINAAGSSSKISVTAGTPAGTAVPPATTPEVAVLIRTAAGWFQSDAKPLAAAATVDYTLVGAGAVAWKSLSGTTDMDEVDNAGESAITAGAAATPNLSQIEGLGLINTLLANQTTNGELWIDKIVITAIAGASNVDEWRAE